MSPKRGRSASLGRSQQERLTAAYWELCTHIESEKDEIDPIRAPKCVAIIEGLLETYRSQEKRLEAGFVDSLVEQLDNAETYVCSRIDPATFTIIVQLILQSEPSYKAQRCLHLLGLSMFNDSNEQVAVNTFRERQQVIGESCLRQLLAYFVDQINDYDMLIWAGLLCIQIVRECPSSREILEQSSDNIRQSLGRRCVLETHEILKIVYGCLIRNLWENGVPLEIMFPVEWPMDVYSGFPPISQLDLSWDDRFQRYIDDLYSDENLKGAGPQLNGIGELVWATQTEMTPIGTINSSRKFGVAGHNKAVFIREGQVLIFASAQKPSETQEAAYEQILDIPAERIKGVIIGEHQLQLSQTLYPMVKLELNENDCICYLDGAEIQLKNISMTVTSDTAESLPAYLKRVCIGLESVKGVDGSKSAGVVGSVSPMSVNDDAPTKLPQSNSQTSVFELGSFDRRGAELIEDGEDEPGSSQIVLIEDSKKVIGSEIVTSEDRSKPTIPDTFDDKVIAKTSEDAFNLMGGATQSVEEARPADNSRRRKGVKPKAKQPIVPSRATKEDQMKTTSDVAIVAKSKVAHQHTNGSIITTPNGASTSKFPKIVLKTTCSSQILGTQISETLDLAATKNPSNKDVDDLFDEEEARKLHTEKRTSAPTVEPKKQSPQLEAEAQGFDDGDTAVIAKTSKQANIEKKAPVKRIQKRHSLTLATKAANALTIYDLSADEDGGTKPTHKNRTVEQEKAKATASKTFGIANKLTNSMTSMKSAADKRKSAPAALKGPAPIARHSRRAAAGKAIEKIKDMAAEDDVADADTGNTAPNLVNPKTDMPEPLSAEKCKTTEIVVFGGENESELSSNPIQEDMMQFDLEPGPEQSSGDPKEILKHHGLHLVESGEAGIKVVGEKGKASGLDMATQLQDIFGGLDDKPSPVVSEMSVSKDETTSSNAVSSLPTPLSPQEVAVDAKATMITSVSSTNGAPKSRFSIFKKPVVPKRVPKEAPNHADLMPENRASEQSHMISMASQSLEHKPKDILEDGAFKPSKHPTEKQSKPETEVTDLTMNTPIATKSLKTALPSDSKKRQAEVDGASSVKRPRVQNQLVQEKRVDRKPNIIAFDAQGPRNQGTPSPLESHDKQGSNVRQKANQDSYPKEMVPVDFTDLPVDQNQGTPEKKCEVPASSTEEQLHEQTLLLGKIFAEISMAAFKNALIQSHGSVDQAIAILSREKAPNNPPGSTAQFSTNNKVIEDGFNGELGDLIPKDGENISVGAKPDMPGRRPAAGRVQGRKKHSSSQASRVNPNGSPLGGSDVSDHIQKLKQRMGNDDGIATNETANAHPQRPGIFGPKVQLGSVPKARPSSPGSETSHYIAHERTGPGSYRGVCSKDIVFDDEKDMPDPFTRNAPESSGFAERLRKEGLEKQRPQNKVGLSSQGPPAREDRGMLRFGRQQTRYKLARDSREAVKGSRGSETNVRAQLTSQGFEPDVRPLAEKERPSQPAPSDTSGEINSADSMKSQNEDFNEILTPIQQWNLAMRSHYVSIHDAVHRIADEVIIQLSDREDIMSLLPQQYKEQGTKLLDRGEQERNSEKASIKLSLATQQTEMISDYSERRRFVSATVEDFNNNTMGSFEKDWRQKNEAIQQRLIEGRKLPE